MNLTLRLFYVVTVFTFQAVLNEVFYLADGYWTFATGQFATNSKVLLSTGLFFSLFNVESKNDKKSHISSLCSISRA